MCEQGLNSRAMTGRSPPQLARRLEKLNRQSVERVCELRALLDKADAAVKERQDELAGLRSQSAGGAAGGADADEALKRLQERRRDVDDRWRPGGRGPVV
jgi:hypothetical protein